MLGVTVFVALYKLAVMRCRIRTFCKWSRDPIFCGIL
jgi:hypothetical protein